MLGLVVFPMLGLVVSPMLGLLELHCLCFDPFQQSRMEERLDDAIHVLRHHAEPQMTGLAAVAGGAHQNLSMMHSGGSHANGMSGMSTYSGIGMSSHVEQLVRR